MEVKCGCQIFQEMNQLIVENLEDETNKMGGKNNRYKTKHGVGIVEGVHIYKTTKNIIYYYSS